ncbi:MAG: TIGR03067 domain-containing protein [Bacteroidota bacterium]|nr:TIGR03067 domain-containing protein [Bacteroidota bacterium]
MKLDGIWNAVDAQLGGQHIDEQYISAITLTVENEKYETVFGGKIDKGTLKYFPNSIPMAIEIKSEEGTNKGKTVNAIYKSSGGYLFVCYNITNSERPKTFVSTPENQFYLVRYKRLQ